MDKALLVQLLGSAVAVALLVGLAAWAGKPRPTPPLDGVSAHRLLAEEFPDHRIDHVWLADDGAGVVARSGAEGLVIWRRGDGYVARSAPWAAIAGAVPKDGRLRLSAVDGVPVLMAGQGVWPPAEAAA